MNPRRQVARIKGRMVNPPLGCWFLWFDGSVHNNGFPNAYGKWAYVIKDPGNITVTTGSGPATGTPVTNNGCEIEGLLYGLRALPREARKVGVHIRGDNRYVLDSIRGRYKYYPEHIALFVEECGRVLIRFRWYCEWIPREQNRQADALSKIVRVK